MSELHNYYVLVEPWAVYVKDAELFVAQGGLQDEWGKRWRLVKAESVEHAQSLGVSKPAAPSPRLNASADGGEMSDTPRTDAEQYDELLRLRGICSDGEPCVVPAGFARDLEREIAELRKQLTFVEAFADPPDTNTSKTTRDELRNQLEQAEALVRDAYVAGWSRGYTLALDPLPRKDREQDWRDWLQQALSPTERGEGDNAEVSRDEH